MIRGSRRIPTRRSSQALGIAVACFLLLLGLAAEAFAFVPRPVPGRVLLKLRTAVDPSTFVSKPGVGVAVTRQPSLDALNARFAVGSFAAQFPGLAVQQDAAAAGYDLSRFFIV